MCPEDHAQMATASSAHTYLLVFNPTNVKITNSFGKKAVNQASRQCQF